MVFEVKQCEASSSIEWSLIASKSTFGFLILVAAIWYMTHSPADTEDSDSKSKRPKRIKKKRSSQEIYLKLTAYLAPLSLILVLSLDILDTYFKGEFIATGFLQYLQRITIGLEFILFGYWFVNWCNAALSHSMKQQFKLYKHTYKSLIGIIFLWIGIVTIGIFQVFIINKSNNKTTWRILKWTQNGTLIIMVFIINGILIHAFYIYYFLLKDLSNTMKSSQKSQSDQQKKTERVFELIRFCGSVVIFCMFYQAIFYSLYFAIGNEFGNNICIALDFMLPIILFLMQFVLLLAWKSTRFPFITDKAVAMVGCFRLLFKCCWPIAGFTGTNTVNEARVDHKYDIESN